MCRSVASSRLTLADVIVRFNLDVSAALRRAQAAIR
jgi:hypothetical protein